ncbi:MAG: NEW3 domain-containing protein [Chloroflexota bacterium]
MKKMKLFRVVCLFLAALALAVTPAAVFAQEQPPPEVVIQPTYPSLKNIAGANFEFEVSLSFLRGTEPRDFDLTTSAPPGWEVYMTPPYEKEKKVTAIRLEPTFSAPQKLRVVATAPFWPLPDPGDYPIGVTISSGDLKSTANMIAKIEAKYILTVIPTAERYNTRALPNQDNFFSIDVHNLGTAPVENIKFTTTKPDGWTMDFNPDTIETLDAFDSQTLELNIKPPTDTVAGDYNITLRASGTQVTANEVALRVTVETPTIWGWVGVGVIVVVVAGLIFVFMRFSRR